MKDHEHVYCRCIEHGGKCSICGFDRWTVSPAKPDFNQMMSDLHDEIDQPQPESWEKTTMSFSKKYGMGVDQTDELFDLVRAERQKEYERGRKERTGEIQAIVEGQARIDTLNEVISEIRKRINSLNGTILLTGRIMELTDLLHRIQELKDDHKP